MRSRVPDRPPPPLPDEPPPTLRSALRLAEATLDECGVGESIADARLLLAHALGATPSWLFAHDDRPVPGPAWVAFRDLVRRRGLREPLQHLLGTQDFWTLRLRIGPQALIPRPETEVLVEATLAAVHGVRQPLIADVGTGSGAVALALAAELPLARIVATDVSREALDLAAANAHELGFDDRIEFRLGSLVEPLHDHPPFSALVANLPYVTAAEWEELEPEVRDFEPRSALIGGRLGTELVQALILQAPPVLAADAFLGLEVGYSQAAAVATRLEERGWRDIGLRRDFAGIERVVSARRP